MASKRTSTRKVARKVARTRRDAESLETVRKLTRRARVELAKLLGQNRRGTITQKNLETGLMEVQTQLVQILAHEYRL